MDLSKELTRLLEELCAEWGFCNRLSGAGMLCDHPRLSGDLFAAAVLTAEGMEPALEKQWFRKISGRFTDRFGPFVSADEPPASRP